MIEFCGGSNQDQKQNVEKKCFLNPILRSAEKRLNLSREIRVLVAENDPAFLKMLEDSLKESQSLYHIKTVCCGEGCLEMLQREKFDILLLDYALPDGTGLN